MLNMPKKALFSRVLKLIVLLAIPLLAGFFAFGTPFSEKQLSTMLATKNGAIIDTKEGFSLSSFLGRAFDSTSLDSARDKSLRSTSSVQVTTGNGSSQGQESFLGAAIKAVSEFIAQKEDGWQEALPPPNDTGEPREEPGRFLYQYFIASSNIEFDTDQGASLESAIRTASEGSNAPLLNVIAGYKEKLKQFRSLAPPKEARVAHDKSVSLIERYIMFLEKLGAAPKEEIRSAWASEERLAFVGEMNAVINAIRDLEKQYNFSLPDDVLP